MWIILLDHSGSMGEPFQGKSEFAGRSRTSQASIKLDAAKSALVEHLAGLGMPSRVALFEFTSTASLIFEGMSDDRGTIQTALDALQADDGTEIATALTEAEAYIGHVQSEPMFRLLVISDGLSDRDRAQQAANQLAGKGVIIDVILIDPTDEGEAVARAIALNGSVSAVTSAQRLSEEVSEAAKQQQTLARQTEEIRAAIALDKSIVAAKVQPAERLSFTAGYPGAASAGNWYSLLIYLHLAGLQDEVMKMLRQRAKQIGLKPVTSTAQAASLIQRGTWLRLTPRIEGIIFNPPSQEVVWYEDIQEVSFRLQAEEGTEGRSLLGAVEVYSGPILIAQIPLALNVRQPGIPDTDTESVTSSVKIFDSVFASYSTQDTAIIDACVAAYEALGIYIYIDKHSLRSGQHWLPMLHNLIEQADLFQLYWSHASCQSSYVEKEWRHALSITGRKGETFIRPLCWEEDRPELPRELSHIQFSRLDLKALSQLTGHSLKTTQLQPTQKTLPAGAYSTLAVTTLPIMPGTTPESQIPIQEDVSHAVNFLEEITGLRYYPVPTLLVDDYVIKSVRAINTVDLVPNANQKKCALALAEVLQRIALDFHAQSLRPPPIGMDQFAKAFGRGSRLTPEQFDYVRQACEGDIYHPTREYYEPDSANHTWDTVRRSLADLGLPFGPDLDFVSFLSRFLALVQDLLNEGLKNLGDFWFAEEAYLLRVKSWELLNQEVTDLKLNAVRPEGSRPYQEKLALRGPFSEFVRVFGVTAARLIDTLHHSAYLATPLHQLFAVEVPTYGIYISDNAFDADNALKRWAFDKGIPTELTLPRTPRVLYSLNAHEQLEKKLQKDSVSYKESRQLAHDFQRCVLLHEHFHAILELGLNEEHRTATGPAFPDVWRAASSLNESLAVWMELHAARDNPRLAELVWAYVRAGSYPEWPYAGAEWIETIYHQGGVGGVRELVTSLRRDPKSAQVMFDEK